MSKMLQRTTTGLILAMASVVAASTASSHAQSASATISGVAAGGGVYDYTVVLQNTGTLSLNSFWYGWTQLGNNLPSDPTTPANSLGWANTLDSNSIKWVNSTGTALAPNQSATFTFDSTTAPADITLSPSGESVAYVGGIDFSQGSAGDSTGIFSPTLVAAPEPSTLSLAGFGLCLLGSVMAKRKLSRSAQIATDESAV